MSRVVTAAVVDDELVREILRPRAGLVAERRVDGVGDGDGDGDRGDGRRGDAAAAGTIGRFEALGGPVTDYRRTVEIESRDGGRSEVRQTVEFRLAVPWFGWLFARPARRRLGRLGPPDDAPWWGPPDVVDARAASVLATLAALSVIAGYMGTLLTQTITFVAQDFGVDRAGQGDALALVRIDIILSLLVVGLADRRGRRAVILLSAAGGCVFTAVGALAPGMAWLVGSQVAARGFLTVVFILVSIVAAEEMPSGSRAYAVSLLAMAAGLGAGVCVMLVALLDDVSWRLLYAFALVGLPLLWRIAPRLPESRRFRAPHATATVAGHGRRFWLLAASGFLLALFTAPAAQFQNEFLRTERGFSAGRTSLFIIATNAPGALGIIAGGRLADVRGRRIVGAVGVLGGVGATVAMFTSAGWGVWAWSIIGAMVGAATVPALGVYGPELFPTSLRGKANGVIAGLARAGSVIGLVAVGRLSRSLGSLGPALAIMALGPLILAGLVLLAYPETAHRELEELNPEDMGPAGPAPPG